MPRKNPYFGGVIGASPLDSNGAPRPGVSNLGGISGDNAFEAPSLDLDFDGTASSGTGDNHWDSVVLLLDGSSLSDDLSDAQNDASVYTNNDTAATGTVSLGTSNGSSVPHPYGVSGVPYIDFAHGDGLQVPSTFDVSGGDWTFECWARFEAGTTGTFDSIFSTAAAGGIQFYYDGTTLKFDKASGTSLTHTAQITLGQWHHVAMTFDYSGGVLTMFIDGVGVSVTSANWVSDIDAYFDASQYNLVFGVNRSNGYPLDGQLTDIRFTAGVIRYTADFEEPKAKLPTAIDASVGTRLATDIVSCTRSTTATFRGSNGLIQTAAVNTPRVEYDASGNALGLLVEESRTNMLTKSSDMTHSDWSAYGSLGVTGGQADPAGGTDAVTLNDSSASAAGQLVQVTATGTAGATYTGSIYVKKTASAASELLLRIKGAGEPQSNCKVDTLNGVVSGNSTAKIEAVNSDWWRVSVSATLSGNVTITMSIFPGHADAYGGSYNVGSIGSHIVYGPQIEQGEAATSYIPTDTTTETRAADDITLATSSFGYNTAAGTTAVDFTLRETTDNYPRVYEVSADTNNRDSLFYAAPSTSLRTEVKESSSSTAWTLVSGVTFPFSAQVALRHDGSNGLAAVDGTLGTSQGIIVAPSTTRTKIGLGQNADFAGNTMNGHIRRFTYWPRAISDASLASYTGTNPPTIDIDRPMRRWGGMTGRSLVESGNVPTTGVLSVPELLQASYSFVLNGSSPARAADSAVYLRDVAGINTNGAYWINVNGTPTLIYCNFTLADGGWMSFAAAPAGPNWFAGDTGFGASWTNLSYSYGTYSTTGAVGSYWRDYSQQNVTELLFVTGDGTKYLGIDIADVYLTGGGISQRQVSSNYSSFPADSYNSHNTATIMHRSSSQEDPWINAGNTHANGGSGSGTNYMFWGETSNPLHVDIKSAYGIIAYVR